MLASSDPAAFAAVFATLYTAHQVGDHWVQTSCQSATKANPGWEGRNACAKHVGWLTITKLAALLALVAVVDVPLSIPVMLLGLAVDAASHYWADRRSTLAALAERLGLGGFYRLGAPRPGHNDNPSLGTGAYALDQSWHVAWLFVAALIIAAGA